MPVNISSGKVPLSYGTYEEAVSRYTPNEKWRVFDGTTRDFNITHECVDRYAEEDRTAINIKHEDGHSERITFSELSRASSQFAYLLERFNVKKGDRVAIILEPCVQFYASLFGCFKRGAVAVVYSPLLGSEAVNYRIRDSTPKLVVSDASGVEYSKNARCLLKEGLMDALRSEGNRTYNHRTTVEDVALIQYTSGTTGLPKPVMYNHKSLVSLAPAARFAYGIREGDSFFCPSPVGWGHILWGGTVAPLMFGVTTGTRSGRFDPQRVFEALEEFKVNNATISPSACRRLLEGRMISRYELEVENMTYTGEALDAETRRRFKEVFGIELHSIYGTTETGVIIAEYARYKDWKTKGGSLGKPILGLEVAILDENDSPPSTGNVGDIAVKRGGRWVRTGDRGLVDEEGYFWYKGRSDDVIKTSGYRIGPEEVESVLNMHEAVLESAVIGVPDKARGQVIKAFIRLKPGYEQDESLVKSIKDFTRSKLGLHAYPREFEFVGSIPKTPEGKIMRSAIRQSAVGGESKFE